MCANHQPSKLIQFHPAIGQNSSEQRAAIVPILEAALASVNPYNAVHAALTRNGHQLQIQQQVYDLSRYRRIFVIGAGKAGAPMVQAIEEILHDYSLEGLVVVKEEHGGPTQQIQLTEASHPIPNQIGVEAGQQILSVCQQATDDDLVIALLSGGGSALLIAPASGITLADLQAMTDTLLSCGATIGEINCLRKHCSAVKGGQLARAAYPATLVTLVLSDVVGNPLDVIASGPTVPDSTTWADAWALVEFYTLEERLPQAVIQRLQAGLRGEIPDTPDSRDPAFTATQTVVVADNRVAADAACAKAEGQGFNTMLLSTFVEGEASEVAKVAVALGKEIQQSGVPIPVPACLIMGGETTVNLESHTDAVLGMGGRNQELALAAALALANTADPHSQITVVSLATDGTDGPTDSAGGIADSGTLLRGQQAGLDLETHLHTHNAYPFLKATNDLLITGPTQTNVNDLIFIFVQGSM